MGRTRAKWASPEREQTHCKRGHELSGTNLRRRKDGKRSCKACDMRWNRTGRYIRKVKT